MDEEKAMSGSEGLLWIVFRGNEPLTAHATEQDARRTAQEAIGSVGDCLPFSIWTARLTHSQTDPGIPIHRLTEAGKEAFPGEMK